MDLSGVPLFPAFRKVAVEDRDLVRSLFSQHPTEVSERTFGSVFMWRLYEDRSRLSQLEGHLLISWRREKCATRGAWPTFARMRKRTGPIWYFSELTLTLTRITN